MDSTEPVVAWVQAWSGLDFEELSAGSTSRIDPDRGGGSDSLDDLFGDNSALLDSDRTGDGQASEEDGSSEGLHVD
jgi:hypothetical protein